MNIKELADETLQAAADAVFSGPNVETGQPLYTLALSKSHDDWNNQKRSRLLLARAMLSRLPAQPKPQPATFQAHGKTWTKHDGGPMPCDGARKVDVLMKAEVGCMEYHRETRPAREWRWTDTDSDLDIIGWRYADEPAIKPWTLPAPPEGQEWHRTDWTEEMLPEGWRPLLKDEPRKAGDEFPQNAAPPFMWVEASRPPAIENKAKENWCHQRTRRPLPPSPILVPLDVSDIRATDEFKSKSGHARRTGATNQALPSTPATFTSSMPE